MPRTPGRPVTQADHDRVRELHAEGLSRNAIAKEIGRSGKTVSEIAVKLGLTFDRTRTRAATEARRDDAKSRRAALALALLGDAERLRAQLWKPAHYVDHGGKEYDRVDWTLDEPAFADKLKLMQSVGIAVDRAVKLDQYDADPGIDAAKSMLGALAAGLGAAYDQLTQPATDGD
ncbi:helix-turn-helix domain-containing protein [Micromonospora sp. LHW51205]|uniref:response regulator transcription factor n=1 Tax=Micromonospora sp. LHW51205 TaxID=2248752 RepID=UPI000DE95770|nr:response regulator transcription factor [Micromonospora sp. LHW51205]RBQ05165.1 helix-turn-helix domain-containing protein [Micromonospora sp. LHW51205]